MREEIIEFIGTFFLVLTIGMVTLEPAAGNLAPVAIGTVLVAMLYMGGPISGGHYNPAVSLAVWLRGKLGPGQTARYVISQVLAGGLAAVLAGFLKGNPQINAMHLSPARALIAEFVFTFALCLVVLMVTTVESRSGNSYFGLAIGLTVLAGAYAMGPISGAAFNPAVAVGITLMGLSLPASLWVYLVANLLGGVAAAGVFRLVHLDA